MNNSYAFEAANDLIRMMMMNGKGKTIEDKISKFTSAGIIKLMIDKDLIRGKSNNEVYEMYVFVAEELKVDILTKDNLMKTLVNFYGFKIINKKIKGKKCRILIDRSEENYIREYTEYCLDMLTDEDIENEPTNKVYKKYQEYCIANTLTPLSNGEFSKQVKKHFDFVIVDKKIQGKKYRIFVKKGSR